uniref:Uncharacterized protein n=1 Tax=Cacopsylla melanoneura TaxID=428564 RepID=A0A8D9B488_9HEMI
MITIRECISLMCSVDTIMFTMMTGILISFHWNGCIDLIRNLNNNGMVTAFVRVFGFAARFRFDFDISLKLSSSNGGESRIHDLVWGLNSIAEWCEGRRMKYCRTRRCYG